MAGNDTATPSSKSGLINEAAPLTGGVDDPNRKAFNNFSDRLADAKDDHQDLPPQQSQGEVMGLGMKLASELLAALIVGGVLGFGADVVFDTKPLFILIGLSLGMAAAFVNVLRMMKKLSYSTENNQPDHVSEDDMSSQQQQTSSIDKE